MPIYRGDFDVHAEIVLPDGAPPLEIKTIQPFMELRLRNGPKDAKGPGTNPQGSGNADLQPTRLGRSRHGIDRGADRQR